MYIEEVKKWLSSANLLRLYLQLGRESRDAVCIQLMSDMQIIAI